MKRMILILSLMIAVCSQARAEENHILYRRTAERERMGGSGIGDGCRHV